MVLTNENIYLICFISILFLLFFTKKHYQYIEEFQSFEQIDRFKHIDRFEQIEHFEKEHLEPEPKSKPVFGQSLSDYIFIFNYNQEGGFFWNVHNVCMLCYIAEKINKIPVVYFDNGYYYEEAKGPNWWEYYYYPVVPVIYEGGIAKLVKDARKNTNAHISVENFEINKNNNANNNNAYVFDRKTFAFLRPIINTDINNFTLMLSKYVKLKPHLQNKIDSFFAEKIMANEGVGQKAETSVKKSENPKKLAVHYRGTDKYSNTNNTEDFPIHVTYEVVIHRIKTYLRENKIGDNYIIFATSDEEPFIKYLAMNFPRKKCVSYDSTRSQLSTSGVELKDSIKCFTGDKSFDETEVCTTYNTFYNQSVHKGMKNVSAYKKGEDVIMDVYLMSKCDVIFKTTGNVSSFPRKINSNLVEINL
jgi:hypothetical protein